MAASRARVAGEQEDVLVPVINIKSFSSAGNGAGMAVSTLEIMMMDAYKKCSSGVFFVQVLRRGSDGENRGEVLFSLILPTRLPTVDDVA